MIRWAALFIIIIAVAGIAIGARGSRLEDASEALERNDFETAFKLLKPLAEAGNQAAQNNLGILYRAGKGAPEDYQEALKWFRRSAEQGSRWAQYNLGLAYDQGQGVPEDKHEAFKWYKLSADQGDAVAQKSLGFMYQEGIGVPQNASEAAKWYKLSADQGDLTARAALMYLSKDLNSFAFIMPPDWFLLPQKATNIHEQLMFRRYSILIDRDSLTKLDSKQGDNLLALGHPGSLINSMIFNCERERRRSDFLTIHLPEYAHPKSFDYSR